VCQNVPFTRLRLGLCHALHRADVPRTAALTLQRRRSRPAQRRGFTSWVWSKAYRPRCGLRPWAMAHRRSGACCHVGGEARECPCPSALPLALPALSWRSRSCVFPVRTLAIMCAGDAAAYTSWGGKETLGGAGPAVHPVQMRRLRRRHTGLRHPRRKVWLKPMGALLLRTWERSYCARAEFGLLLFLQDWLHATAPKRAL
jgi:hypothetical protein